MHTHQLRFLPFFLVFAAFGAPTVNGYVPDPWERQVVAACLILEASCQGREGMHAVMSVIQNRAGGSSAKIYREVLRPYQFSALNSATTRPRGGGTAMAALVTRASRDPNWRLALELVDLAYSGRLDDITRGSTYYSLVSENVYWMQAKRPTVVIGAHKFFAK